TENAGEHKHNVNSAANASLTDSDQGAKTVRALQSNPADIGVGNNIDIDMLQDGAHFHVVPAHNTQPASDTSAAPHENRPPYYVLAFIMRVY
ncbi:MAG TPA: hypothetical protein VHO90_20655, partial [Bacteroidales bacterium]|nr:hypothetical protein [Bacteroidales bacterium]